MSLLADPISFSPSFNRRKGRVQFREFELQQMGFPMQFRAMARSPFARVRGYSRIRNWLLDGRKHSFDCTGEFQGDFMEMKSPCVLTGYFQDRRYFSHYSDEIAELVVNKLTSEFAVAEPLDGVVHVRRGDYLSHPEFYPEWFQDYATLAVSHLEQNMECKKITVFSDDLTWCRKNLRSRHADLDFATPDRRLGGAGDMWRMANARVLAIANSTFSWWAGFLGSRNGNAVVAPARWSTWCKDPLTCLYHENWNILSR